MVEVPADTPDTTPVEEFTVATPVALLLHVPPVVVELKVVVDPAHTAVVPVMAPTVGNGFTVTVTTLLARVVPPETAFRRK